MKYSFNTIFFEATRRCNLKCSLCMASSNIPERVRESVKKELSTDEIERHILATAREIGVQVMTWSGGEFFVRQDALELVRRAHKYGYQSSICTNGKLATRERLLTFNEATEGTLVIAVGINSIDNENAWTRDSDADLSMKVLTLCKELGIKRHVVVNVGRHNLKTIAKTLQWLEDEGIPYNRSPFTARGSGACYFKELTLSRQEMEQVLHPQLRKHPNGYISYTPFFLSPEMHAKVSGGKKNVTVPQNPSMGCFIGTWLGITAEGEISPCGILLDVINCGNVRDKTLQQLIDDSPAFQQVLNRNNLKGKCARCRYKFVCGGCRAMAYFAQGDLLAEDPQCFFEPVDESTVSEHETETGRSFKRYYFMVRHAGRSMVNANQKDVAPDAKGPNAKPKGRSVETPR